MIDSSVFLQYAGIRKTWKRKTILEQIDIELHGGECLLISGENGSGKSTLLRILAGLLKPDAGSVTYGKGTLPWKKTLKQLSHQVMYLHQTPYLFAGTVEKNLAYVRASSCNTQAKKALIQEAMQWAGIDYLAKQSVTGLSGGERQRVALARAWIKRPKALLLDEPTANLDQQSRQRTVELICCLKKQGVAIVIASHDPLHFEQAIDTRLLLENGRLNSAIPESSCHHIATEILDSEVYA